MCVALSRQRGPKLGPGFLILFLCFFTFVELKWGGAYVRFFRVGYIRGAVGSGVGWVGLIKGKRGGGQEGKEYRMQA